MSTSDCCQQALARINKRIFELRNTSIAGQSVRRDVIEFERWMRSLYEMDEYASIRDLIEPCRFRVALTASTSFYRNWRHYMELVNPDRANLWPFACLQHDNNPARRDQVTMRWKMAGGIIVDKNRLIAPSNSPVWSRFSVFSVPYPPFDQYLDIQVIEIDRDEACKLGLMRADDIFAPQTPMPEPDTLTIDSDVVSLMTDANRLSFARVSPA